MAAVLIRPNASEKSRLRLFVVQALVLSLFLTLFARLWYMQVLTGEGYQAAGRRAVGARRRRPAGPRPDRRRHGPPARGQPQQLGGQHRPHPARQARPRTSARPPCASSPAWSTCRTRRSRPARCCAASPARSRAPAGTARPTSRCRSPATSRRRSRSRCSSSPRTTRACWPSRRACAPTPRRTASTAPTCSATSARSPRASSTRPTKDGDTSVNGASVVGRAGVEKAYDQWLRGSPGYKKVAVDSMGRVLGDSGEIESDARATRWSPPSTPRCRATSRSSCTRRSPTARGTFDKVTGKNYVADSGAAVVMEAKTGRDRRDGQPADVRPRGLVRRHHQASSSSSSTPRRPATRCSRAPPRASSRPARRGSRS